MTARGVYNDVSKNTDPRYSALFSHKFADGTFGVLASAAYQLGNFGALLRTQRFGEVTVSHTPSIAQDQTFGARWITDANASYTLLRKYTFTAGADNLFDVYPASDPFNLPFVDGLGTDRFAIATKPECIRGRYSELQRKGNRLTTIELPMEFQWRTHLRRNH